MSKKWFFNRPQLLITSSWNIDLVKYSLPSSDRCPSPEPAWPPAQGSCHNQYTSFPSHIFWPAHPGFKAGSRMHVEIQSLRVAIGFIGFLQIFLEKYCATNIIATSCLHNLFMSSCHQLHNSAAMVRKLMQRRLLHIGCLPCTLEPLRRPPHMFCTSYEDMKFVHVGIPQKVKILRRDLKNRSCQEATYRELVQGSLPRDLLKRVCAKKNWMDLAKRFFIGNLHANLARRSPAVILPMDLL